MVIATKLRVLADFGARAWRPKDLADVWRLLRRFEPRRATLGEALLRSAVPRALLAASWWQHPHARMRWHGYTHGALPAELDAAVGEISDTLRWVA